MSNKKDLLTPDKSPSKLENTGVKRVNNLPLFIVIGVLTVFVILIGLVAQKRAAAQANEIEVVKPRASSNQTAMSLANEVVGKRVAGIVPSAKVTSETTQTLEIPVAVLENPDAPPKPYVGEIIPDEELVHIRQEKIQQFEEAVKAKIAVDIDRDALQPQTQKTNQKQEALNGMEGAALFRAKLQTMQTGFQNDKGNKPKPQSLGGEENEGRWQLHSKLENPQTPFELIAGAVIPGVMVSGIRSDLPNQIIGQVSQNVYDTATGRHLLIPQGTKVFGLYSSDVSYGQDTLLVAWQRLTFPDGKTLDIGSMPGADNAGMGGFRDQVDNHYGRIFGSALLMSGIVGGISYSQNQANQGPYTAPTAGSVLSQSLGQQLGEVTAQMIAKNLNIAPSLKISTGYEFNIIVVKDLVFKKPYSAFDY